MEEKRKYLKTTQRLGTSGTEGGRRGQYTANYTIQLWHLLN